MPEHDDRLFDELGIQGRQTLRYVRARFLGTWLALALLALLTGLALWVSSVVLDNPSACPAGSQHRHVTIRAHDGSTPVISTCVITP